MAARDTLPNKISSKSSRIWRDDVEINKLFDQRMGLSRASLEFKLLSKQIKRRITKLRNLKLKEEAEEINSFASKRKIEEMYRAFKNDSSSFESGKSNEKCDPAALKKFFEGHFGLRETSPTPTELITKPNFSPPLSSNPLRVVNIDPPTYSEISIVLSKLKGGKSANDIPPDFIKCAIESNKIMKEILNLYSKIWKTKIVPEKWGLSRLVALWKGASKGKTTDPNAYRGLQIGSTL